MAKGKKNGKAEKKPRERKTAEKLSDEQRQALLFSHKRNLKPLLAQEALAKGAVVKAFELAKKEGIPKKEIKIAIALESEEGEEACNAEVERYVRVARWMGVPLGTQREMFSAGKPSAAEANFEAGKRAALDDLPAIPPAHLGQKAADVWLSGHAEGRKIPLNVERNVDRASGFKPLSEVVNDLIPPAPEASSMPAM
jgi:hypothetical protein